MAFFASLTLFERAIKRSNCLRQSSDHLFANATAQCSKLKHIDCRQEWVKTLRNKNVCNTVHIPTKDNLADIFTKILPSGDFIRLRDQLLHPMHTN